MRPTRDTLKYADKRTTLSDCPLVFNHIRSIQCLNLSADDDLLSVDNISSTLKFACYLLPFLIHTDDEA